MTEEYNNTKPDSKFQIDLLLRLGMYSLLSLICFWFPLLIIYKYREIDDGRTGGAFLIVVPFVIFAFIYSTILLKRLVLSLKQVKYQRRFILGILGVMISLPTLIAGILITVYSVGIILVIVGWHTLNFP